MDTQSLAHPPAENKHLLAFLAGRAEPRDNTVLTWLTDGDAARATATPGEIEESEIHQSDYGVACETALILARGDRALVAAMPLAKLVSSARQRGEDVRVAVVRHVRAKRKRIVVRRIPRSTMPVRRARRAPRRTRRAARTARSRDDSAGPPSPLAAQGAPSAEPISRREQSSRAVSGGAR